MTKVAVSSERALAGGPAPAQQGRFEGWRWGRASACLALALACQAEGAGRRAGAEPGLQANLAAATSATAADPAVAQAPSAPQQRPSEALSVILITVEALRADMPWAGYARPIAPTLTQLAAESAVWRHQHSVSSHTPQAIATLLSGRYPSTLYRDGAFATSYAADNTFFPELLHAQGIRTIGVPAGEFFRKGKGFEQGFDVWELVAGGEGSPAAADSSSSAQSATRLIELLGQPQNTAGQFFAWAHFMDPHQPYLAHPEVGDFGKQPRDLYDSEVAFTDHWLGKVLEFARQQVWWKRTALIVVGDHGEALGEHGASAQGADLWQVLLQTPLLIRAPGARPVQIEPARSHLDLAPTIVELMGVAPSAAFQGQSLMAELYGAPAAPRPALLFELCEDAQNPGWRALLSGDDKFMVPGVANGPERLFDLKQDPGELANVAEKQPQKLREMAVRFEREFSRVPRIEPYGGMKLKSGRLAQGPEHPASSAAPEK
ncbi:MAG TPA: sulfatase [Polyangiaceae bacterium]|nr:sulfatase [Polyangiaceae bacterium]